MALRAEESGVKKFDSDERARMAYLDREKYLRDQTNLIHMTKLGGREEGWQERLYEGDEKAGKDVAARMKALGLDAGTISVATGLPVGEL